MIENEQTDIWVIDLRQEAHLGRCHWVFLRQKELQFKLSFCIIDKDMTGIRSFSHSLSNGLPPGPSIITSKYLRLSSWGRAETPGAGSATSRSVSYKKENNGKCRHKDSVQDIFGLFNLDNSLRSD